MISQLGEQRGAVVLGAVLVLGTVLAMGGVAHAAGEPKFGGSFDWGNVAQDGEAVWVTVTVELFQREEGLLYEVTLTLDNVSTDPSEPSEIYVGTLAAGEVAKASGDLQIPGWEYLRWLLASPRAAR